MSRTTTTLVTAGLVLLLLAGWAASARVQMAIDPRIAPYRNTPDMLWISSGKVLKDLSLGNNGLLADIYWTRAVQYNGSRIVEHSSDFKLLAPLLNIAVDLDPNLIIAYRFGAIFLSESPPHGAGRPDEAVRLIRKGIEANPDQWRLWHDLGFIYYWDLKNYRAAAAAYLEGSKNPKAEPWMKVMAAVITEKGGNRKTSRFLWAEIYRSAQDKSIKQNALEHLQGLRVLDDMDELAKRVDLFRKETGQWPTSFSDLIQRGLLRGIPTDPLGFAYHLGPGGSVTLNPKSKIRLQG